MITASELAGYFAAHAIWCVSDAEGEPLIPMLAYTTESGERKLERLAHEDLAGAVDSGKQRLDANEMDADDAVLVYDARIPVNNEKLDAIILEMRAYFSPGSAAVIAVPYLPSGVGPFRAHRPKILGWDNCEDFDLNQVIESFFQGVDAHEKGAAVWNKHIDQSK